MRRAICCVLAVGCGYGSYYPSPTSRSQGDLSLDTAYTGPGGGGSETPCTDPAGRAAGESVELTVNVIAPVRMIEVYEDCTLGGSAVLDVGETWMGPYWAGVVFRIESPEGAYLDYLQIPFGTGGTWYAEVP